MALRILLCLVFFQSQLVFAKSPAVQTENPYTHLKKVKNLDGLFKVTEKRIPPKVQKFLKAKAKNLKSTKLRFQKKKPHHFLIEVDSILVPVKAMDPTKGLFAINNQQIEFYPGEPLENIWKKVVKALPKANKKGASILIPEAHAFDLGSIFKMAIGVMAGMFMFSAFKSAMNKVNQSVRPATPLPNSISN